MRKKQKILYFDVETTGLDCKVNEITQLAGIVEVEGEVVEEFNITMCPNNWDSVSDRALQVAGVDRDKLKTFQSQEDGYNQFLDILDNHVDKFDSSDKCYFAGYNVNFDVDFLSEFFKKNNNNFLGSYVNWKKLDPLPMLWVMEIKGEINLPNYKLSTVCKHYDIEIDAHDALSDVKATRALFTTLLTN